VTDVAGERTRGEPTAGHVSGPPPGTAATDDLAALDERNLVLDELAERLERFRIFRKTDSAEADRVLEEIGAQSAVDRDIVLELSSTHPLGHPDRFPEAHAMAMRALEVLDRNGGRRVTVRRAGPLAPLAAVLVQLVARFIIRSHQATVIDAIRLLYARRESSCLAQDPARPMLSRARIHAERVAQGYKRNPIGLPSVAVVLGGAAVSSLGRVVLDAISPTRTFAIVATVAAFVVVALVAWIILQGAAVARRRIRLTIEQPLAALWETVGRCGRPPRDQARQFALYAIVLTAIGWIVIPVGAAIAFALG
jgi:hypothetical protein